MDDFDDYEHEASDAPELTSLDKEAEQRYADCSAYSNISVYSLFLEWCNSAIIRILDEIDGTSKTLDYLDREFEAFYAKLRNIYFVRDINKDHVKQVRKIFDKKDAATYSQHQKYGFLLRDVVEYVYKTKFNFDDNFPLPGSHTDRFALIMEFAKAHDEEETARYAAALIPSLSYDGKSVSPAPNEEISLADEKLLTPPEEPPELWVKRRKLVIDPDSANERLQNANEFLEEIYHPWKGVLTRNWLRANDNALFQALYRTNGAELHPTFPLPTIQELNDRMVGKIGSGEVSLDEHLGKFTAAEAAREMQRLAGAARRRTSQGDRD